MLPLKEQIIRAALEIAARVGIAATSRNAIAARVECSTGSVSFHWGNGRELARAIVTEAIARENHAVMGAAIAERHAAASSLDAVTRAVALRAWIGK